MKNKYWKKTDKELVVMAAEKTRYLHTNKFYRDFILNEYGRKVTNVTVCKAIGSTESRTRNDIRHLQTSARKFLLDCNHDYHLARHLLYKVAL